MGGIHAGLKTEVVTTAAGGGVEFTLGRVIHGKDDTAHGLHANPTSFSISGGVQRFDFLAWIGFSSGTCPFLRSGRNIMCKPVDSAFDIAAFVSAFDAAYAEIQTADRHLQECGFFLESRDFPAKHWVDRGGDGHTGSDQQQLKVSEDEHFRFVLSWLKRGSDGGWTTHYRAKELPLSPEMQSVFAFLGLREFDSCIEFEFESCHWRRLLREARGDGFFDSNNETVHKWYNNHAARLSPGIEHLLAAEAALSPFGLKFLPRPTPPVPGPGVRPPLRAERWGVRDAVREVVAAEEEEFDVAISFAGTERPLAEDLATQLRDAGVRVFYDRFYGAQLWGKHLPEYFDRIFRKQARFCVMFLSAAYRDRIWTTMERRSAIARAIESKGGEYILPIMVEQVDIDGLPPTVGYLAVSDHSIQEIARMLLEKLER
jgi:hypothetical protein